MGRAASLNPQQADVRPLAKHDLVQRRARKPVGVPSSALAREVTKVGIVGAGPMASQLALLIARWLAVPVVLTDLDQERIDHGIGYVHTGIGRPAGRPGRPTEGTAAKLRGPVTGPVDKAAFTGADLVVVAETQDIDLHLILGAGRPFRLGGVTPYLDRTGIAETVTGQRFPPTGAASRPS
jgi:3-hydroxyacyl-CoA dehydrogenase, NAD binding domain